VISVVRTHFSVWMRLDWIDQQNIAQQQIKTAQGS